MIGEGHRANFETLKRAILQGDACILECRDKKTGEDVPVICAVQYSGDDREPYEFVPLAKLFNENPYEEMEPPT